MPTNEVVACCDRIAQHRYRFPVGDKLGHYEILAPIGAGGMGEVYRARDPRLNRDEVSGTVQRGAGSRTILSRYFTPTIGSPAALCGPVPLPNVSDESC
jgi:serine/threonine protein kinase